MTDAILTTVKFLPGNAAALAALAATAQEVEAAPAPEAPAPEAAPEITFKKIYSGYYAVQYDGETVGYIDSGRAEGGIGRRATYDLWSISGALFTSGTIHHCKKTALRIWG